MAGFPGFPKDLFKFLRELKKNNNKTWFNDNKPRYLQSVVEPMIEFISVMEEPLRKISPHFRVDTRRNGGSMFRIYRDTRFSKVKTPYKENVGCQFRHEQGKDAHAPGFYVHLEPKNVFFGGGLWMPPNPELHKIRQMIDVFPKSWETVINDRKIKQRFGGVQGDGLSRPPQGFAKDHPYIEDLKRKSFYLMQEADESLVTSPKFIKEVEKSFQATAPMMKFLCRCLEVPY
ncbi:MAG: DUF2461 domain-containing protein [Gammaproteobacteria bacterium]|nr:DUF2461 domain-containing protein [Gammaproteobacteria bacterium]